MPLTITKVTGIGISGSPPTPALIQVEGTVSGCETVYVTVSCSDEPVEPGIQILTGGVQPWSIAYKNTAGAHAEQEFKSLTVVEIWQPIQGFLLSVG